MDGIDTTCWRILGLYLKLPWAQIKAIDDGGSEYVMIEILNMWVKGNGNPATMQNLVTAVRELNLALAERLATDSDLLSGKKKICMKACTFISHEILKFGVANTSVISFEYTQKLNC